jgi:hypothetical protein
MPENPKQEFLLPPPEQENNVVKPVEVDLFSEME